MAGSAAPRTTCPGLPRPSTECPKCHQLQRWAREPQIDGAWELGCISCGAVVADWEPGLPDWVVRPAYRPGPKTIAEFLLLLSHPASPPAAPGLGSPARAGVPAEAA